MIKKLKLDELQRVDVNTYRQMEKHDVVLVLDNIRSALNVGSAFRSADAFAVEKICLVGITPVPPHTDISKAAIGATLSVEHEYFADMQSCLLQLRKEQFHVIGLEQTTHSIKLQKFRWPKKVAIIVGNEVNGISENAIPSIDEFIEIPQFGTKHSLNVAVAVGLVLWDYVKSQLG